MLRIIFYCIFSASVSSLHRADRSDGFDKVFRLMPDTRKTNSLWANPQPYIPKAGGLHPGHTLLKPKKMTLQSAVKYPKHKRTNDHLVYGNSDNLNLNFKTYMKNDQGHHPRHKKGYIYYQPKKVWLGLPKGRAQIPKVGGLHPGHALLKPKGRILESAAKFPLDNIERLVYGNRNNLGITYNKTNQRVLYTGFRRLNHDTVDNILLEAIRKVRYQDRKHQRKSQPVVVIAIEPGAEEIMDETSQSSEKDNRGDEMMDLRRTGMDKYRRKDHIGINREKNYFLISTESSDSDKSSSYAIKSRGHTSQKNTNNLNWLNYFKLSNLLRSLLMAKSKAQTHKASGIHPRHLLLKPKKRTLKSAIKKPSYDILVFGNLENLKALDGASSAEDKLDNQILILRRAAINKHKTDRRKDHVPIERQNNYHALSSSSSSESGSSSSEEDDETGDYEANPGNPYTLYKDRYKQNWMWNHNLDGDHMNINPYAPVMNNVGPSGVDLFFGRKWWYFNQDDYRPLG